MSCTLITMPGAARFMIVMPIALLLGVWAVWLLSCTMRHDRVQLGLAARSCSHAPCLRDPMRIA